MRFSWPMMTAFVLVVLCWCALPPGCAAADKADKKDHMSALLKERVDTAKAIYDLMVEKYNHGAGNIGSVHRAKMAWLNAKLSLAETKSSGASRLYEEIFKEAKEWEQMALQNLENGAGERIEALTARADRIEAEIALERSCGTRRGEDSTSQARKRRAWLVGRAGTSHQRETVIFLSLSAAHSCQCSLHP